MTCLRIRLISRMWSSVFRSLGRAVQNIFSHETDSLSSEAALLLTAAQGSKPPHWAGDLSDWVTSDRRNVLSGLPQRAYQSTELSQEQLLCGTINTWQQSKWTKLKPFPRYFQAFLSAPFYPLFFPSKHLSFFITITQRRLSAMITCEVLTIIPGESGSLVLHSFYLCLNKKMC